MLLASEGPTESSESGGASVNHYGWIPASEWIGMDREEGKKLSVRLCWGLDKKSGTPHLIIAGGKKSVVAPEPLFI